MSLSRANRAGERSSGSAARLSAAVLCVLAVLLLSLLSGQGQPAAAAQAGLAAPGTAAQSVVGDQRFPDSAARGRDAGVAPAGGALVRTGSDSATQFSLVAAGALLLGLGFVALAGRKTARARTSFRGRR